MNIYYEPTFSGRVEIDPEQNPELILAITIVVDTMTHPAKVVALQSRRPPP